MICKRLVLGVLGVLTAMIAGCTLEEPFWGDFCPVTELRDNGEYLSYIQINDNKCVQAMCRSKNDCCGLTGESAEQAYNTFVYSRCAKGSAFGKCHQDEVTSEWYCGPDFQTVACDPGWHASKDGKTCEEDSVTACGYYYLTCMKDGVLKAECILEDGAEKSKCVVSACEPNHHIKNDGCVLDTTTACGVEEINCEATSNTKLCSNGYCSESCSDGTESCKGQCIIFELWHVVSCTNGEMICEPGWADADGMSGNGCEYELSRMHVDELAADGKSIVKCTDEFENCDGVLDFDANNGCEAYLPNDVNNCKKCGNKCATDYVCGASDCVPGCPAGQDYCGNCMNFDINHIQACDKNENDEWYISECKFGFENCNMDMTDGCEAELVRDNNNCSKCDEKCESGLFCSGGQCGRECMDGETICGDRCMLLGDLHIASCIGESITCQSGYENCNGSIYDGCEVDITRSPDNCGGCALGETSEFQCQKDEFCSEGHCSKECGEGLQLCIGVCLPIKSLNIDSCDEVTKTLKCVSGYGNCNGSLLDGCETDFSGDIAHCGACSTASESHKCDTGKNEVCSDGRCEDNCPSGSEYCNGKCLILGDVNIQSCDNNVIRCQEDFEDCDKKVGNGCETDLRSNSSHCGSCQDEGHQCDIESGERCSERTCQMGCGGTTQACGEICIDFEVNHISGCDSNGLKCAEGYMDCNGIITDGCEINIKENGKHCGECNNKCDSGKVCLGGRCETSCPGGQVACGGRCIDPKTDLNYCGAEVDSETNACKTNGRVCESGNVCTNGACQVSCLVGQVNCGGKCIDPMNDHDYCGATGTVSKCVSIGTPCTKSQICNNGVCENADCRPGYVACGNDCINPLSDQNYCGANDNCSLYDACVGGQQCDNGTCRCVVGSALFCKTASGNQCIDSNTSNTNCGCTETSTGQNCEAMSADGEQYACVYGECKLTKCSPGETECSSGCINVHANDRNNCGGCNISCSSMAPSNAQAVGCDSGVCKFACISSDYFNTCLKDGGDSDECSLMTKIRCEVKGTNTCCGENCETCGANESCSGGRCIESSCDSGKMYCDSDPESPCKDVSSDKNHCGRCDNNCGEQTDCHDGTCTCTDSAKYNCGTDAEPLCVNLQDEPEHCGNCNTNCETTKPANTHVVACNNGQCEFECNDTHFHKGGSGYAINCVEKNTNTCCGDLCENCENLNTERDFYSCDVSTGQCVNYGCGLGEMLCGTSCTNVASTDVHCGTCNHACPSNQKCNGSGTCVCRQDTDTLCNNECVNVQNNASHCGGCNTVCSNLIPANAELDTNACLGGKCQFKCKNGYVNMGTSGSLYCVLRGTATCCGNSCVNCTTTYGNNYSCSNATETGVCVISACPLDQSYCGSCVEHVSSNNDHCGVCDNKCGEETHCQESRCVCNEESLTNCGKDDEPVCVDVKSDTSYCGNCYTNCESIKPANTRVKSSKGCNNGTCQFECVNNYYNKGGNTLTTINCVKKGITCCGSSCEDCTQRPDDVYVCLNNNCVKSNCDAGHIQCGSDGCVDYKNDKDHCGDCETQCGDNMICSNGGCVCEEENKTNCGDTNAPACYDLKTDKKHCGDCDMNCVEMDGWKDGECEDGHCHANECMNGYCNDDGTCRYGMADANNCGSGGECKNCSSTSVIPNVSRGYCDEGVCKALICKPGYHVYNNRCEANSDQHCGSHDMDCTALPLASGSTCKNLTSSNPSCDVVCDSSDYELISSTAGCRKKNCDSGQVNCGTGLELNCVTENDENCGYCGNNCNAQAGWKTSTCTNHQCKATSCNPNYCLSSNQCVDGRSATYTCGITGGACVNCSQTSVLNTLNASSAYCNNGVCKPLVCSGTRLLCDGSCIEQSTTHCGACNINCASIKPQHSEVVSCSNSQCQFRCVTGYSNTGSSNSIDTVDKIYCVKDEPVVSCDDGIICNGDCVSPDSDEHCGTCDNNCNSEELYGGWINNKCVDKKCKADGCSEDSGKCFDNEEGICVNGLNDPNKCGVGDVCVKCEYTGEEGTGEAYCNNGSCDVACNPGFTKVDGEMKCTVAYTPTTCTSPKLSCVISGVITCIDQSVNNCGNCNNKCSDITPHNASIKSSGGCANNECHFTCNSSYANAGSGDTASTINCVSTGTDSCCYANGNGSCYSCPTGKECRAGSCKDKVSVETCTEVGFAYCDTGCVSIINDQKNCGRCGHQCSDEQHCENYECVCNEGSLTLCEGTCVDTKNGNVDNCGACGYKCSEHVPGWSDGQCQNSQCVPTACEGGDGDYCILNKACYYGKTDSEHCGINGETCQSCPAPEGGNGSPVCDNGSCTVRCDVGYELLSNNTCKLVTSFACNNGQLYCGGTCVNNDRSHCGSCSNSCPTNSDCVSGQCVCNGSLTLCGGTCVNTTGGEVDNCGACGYKCSERVPGWSGGKCENSQCVPTGCSGGDGNYCIFKSACYYGKTDNAHCGTRGSTCNNCNDLSLENGFYYCNNGACRQACNEGYYWNGTNCEEAGASMSCNPGFDMCGGSECVSLSEPEHCGSCENNCTTTPGWRNGNCNGSTCEATSCTEAYCLDNKQCLHDDTHCGSSCTDCSSKDPYGSAACSEDGTCVLTGCDGGYVHDRLNDRCYPTYTNVVVGDGYVIDPVSAWCPIFLDYIYVKLTNDNYSAFDFDSGKNVRADETADILYTGAGVKTGDSSGTRLMITDKSFGSFNDFLDIEHHKFYKDGFCPEENDKYTETVYRGGNCSWSMNILCAKTKTGIYKFIVINDDSGDNATYLYWLPDD